MTEKVIDKIKEFIEDQSTAKLGILLTFVFLLMTFSNIVLVFLLVLFVVLPIILIKCYLMYEKREKQKLTLQLELARSKNQKPPAQNAPLRDAQTATNKPLPLIQYYPQPIPIPFPYYQPQAITQQNRQNEISKDATNNKQAQKSPKSSASNSQKIEKKDQPVEIKNQQSPSKSNKVGDRKNLTNKADFFIEELSAPIKVKEDLFHADEEIVIQ
ncbi:Oidioi.mRNA.OKI2018_I69.PAR.g9658.t1.cds [Oikopleura dioica]|uniref:Oidioi.mRNA.OKI2018_I69.PAR.g9658.t1.cds n=1 Tax=Oikopleura dioica TaxID=34765 RepID=A0ABN7RS01_OIKDI|nr:Oidioi.mRNA.OKI2018_I69.PAR.g9658.t1.cds [Oikopleura dioica]